MSDAEEKGSSEAASLTLGKMRDQMAEKRLEKPMTVLARTLFAKVEEVISRRQRMKADHPKKYDPASGSDGNHPFAHVNAQSVTACSRSPGHRSQVTRNGC